MPSCSVHIFMVTKRVRIYFIIASFAFLIHFAGDMPHSLAIDLTSVIALTSDVQSGNLIEKNGTLKEDGAVCVFNGDCLSGCCIYANSASGVCVVKAGIGQVCGFVYGADVSLETHYRICQNCDTYCCCGTACCPTDYCLAALQLKSFVCTSCSSGCCCNNTCCPITYCVSTGVLKENNIKGKLCLRCQSGCCCGDSCCVSSFCRASVVGHLCLTCATGCCCDHNICCPASYCTDSSALSTARALLAMFDASSKNPDWSNNKLQLISNAISRIDSQSPAAGPLQTASSARQAAPPTSSSSSSSSSEGQGTSAAASAIFPVLAPAPLRVLGGGIMGSKIKAYVCIQCTTGCCCEVGCCSYIYCTV